MCRTERASDDPELIFRVCSACGILEQFADLPPADKEAIVSALSRGVVSAVAVARERLGWSLSKAKELAYLLRDRAEPNPSTDGGT
jgi:hypothetical protein